MAETPLSLGLIGYPLGHSLSPRLHAAALQDMRLPGEYRLYPLAPGPELEPALTALLGRMRRGEIHGLNVTVPHKPAVIPFLDECTPAAGAIGAVNTIYFRNGRLVGDNTDAPGFQADLRRAFPELEPPGLALALGAGGAARAVVYALLVAGWRVAVLARRLEQAEALVAGFQRQAAMRGERLLLTAHALEPAAIAAVPETPRLIVNASTAGMEPHVATSPWPGGVPLPPGACVYDLVYKPAETALLRQARRAGLPHSGGIGMLIEQAALALELWTGRTVSRAVMWSAIKAQTTATDAPD